MCICDVIVCLYTALYVYIHINTIKSQYVCRNTSIRGVMFWFFKFPIPLPNSSVSYFSAGEDNEDLNGKSHCLKTVNASRWAENWFPYYVRELAWQFSVMFFLQILISAAVVIKDNAYFPSDVNFVSNNLQPIKKTQSFSLIGMLLCCTILTRCIYDQWFIVIHTIF